MCRFILLAGFAKVGMEVAHMPFVVLSRIRGKGSSSFNIELSDSNNLSTFFGSDTTFIFKVFFEWQKMLLLSWWNPFFLQICISFVFVILNLPTSGLPEPCFKRKTHPLYFLHFEWGWETFQKDTDKHRIESGSQCFHLHFTYMG